MDRSRRAPNSPPGATAIIGAGPCGLAACKALSEAGLSFTCFEAADEIGGIWNVGKRPGGYRSLMTNTSNPNMAFSDFPFAPDDPAYLSADQLVRYFDRYCDHFGFRDHIRLGTRVRTARRSDDRGWILELETGESLAFDHLVVATGQYNQPYDPHAEIPGEFSGEHLHVHRYYDVESPVDLSDKRVLIVGLGTSAAEIAAELSDSENPGGAPSEVSLSVRSGRWVLPKVIDGQPFDRRAPHAAEPLPGLFKHLPMGLSAWIMRRLMGRGFRSLSASLGGNASLGLPEPVTSPWAERPTLSFDFIPALQAGRIQVRPDIQRFDGNQVVFADGSSAAVDVIIYATGYRTSLPFLTQDTLGCAPDDLHLYQGICHPQHDDLFFIGYRKVMCALWPVAEQQSRWLARLLQQRFTLPDARARRRKAIDLRQSLPVICNVYVEELRRQAGGTL